MLISNHYIVFEWTNINQNCPYPMAKLNNDAVFSMQKISVSSLDYHALHKYIDFKQHAQDVATVAHVV